MGTKRTVSKEEELSKAEREVEQSKADLAQTLQEVGESGEKLLNRVKEQVKPGLVIGAVVAGAVVLTGAALLFRRPRRRGWLASRSPSTLGVVSKAVGLWALKLAARKAAQAAVARLEAAQSSTEAPAQ